MFHVEHLQNTIFALLFACVLCFLRGRASVGNTHLGVYAEGSLYVSHRQNIHNKRGFWGCFCKRIVVEIILSHYVVSIDASFHSVRSNGELLIICTSKHSPTLWQVAVKGRSNRQTIHRINYSLRPPAIEANGM